MTTVAQSAASPGRISMFRGDSHTVEVTVKEKNPANLNGPLIPVDITGAAAVLTVKTRASDTTIKLQVTGTVLSPGTDGKIRFEIAPADTASFKPSAYPYDVQVTFADERVFTVVRDNFEVKEDVTTA